MNESHAKKKTSGFVCHIKAPLALFDCQQLGKPSFGKTKRESVVPKNTKPFRSHHFFEEGLFSPSFQKDADSQDDQTCSDSHEDPQIRVVKTASPPPLCCGSE